MEDSLLIWKLKRGNRDALRQIYEKYRSDLLRVASGLLSEATQAEDTVHDVFVVFVESCRHFKLTGSLRSYLVTCVANRARIERKLVNLAWDWKTRLRGYRI